MKIKQFTATSALVIATVGICTGTAYAEPVSAPPTGNTVKSEVMPGIHWDAKVVDKSVVITTDIGSLTARDDQFQVLDGKGDVVAGLPLSYFRDGMQYPIAARVDGNTATLTPSTDPAQAHPADMPVKQVDAQADFNGALGAAATQFGLATGVGTLIGTIIGLVGGCVLGAVTVGALTAPIFFAGAPGGCIMGAATGAAVGAAAGMILLGVPVGIASAIQFFQTINSPAPAN